MADNKLLTLPGESIQIFNDKLYYISYSILFPLIITTFQKKKTTFIHNFLQIITKYTYT